MPVNQSICAFHNLLLGRAKEIKLRAISALGFIFHRNLGQHCAAQYTSCKAFSGARPLPELQWVFCCASYRLVAVCETWPCGESCKGPFQLISKECCTKAATLLHQCISRKPLAEIEMTHSYCGSFTAFF